MKPVIRYQSQLLFRKSYKPARTLRFRPVRKAIFSTRSICKVSDRITLSA